MWRSILSVVVGYLVMGVLVMGLMTGVYFLIGQDKAYQPGVYDISTTWIAISFVVGIAASLVGGVACALIANRGSRAAKVLAGVIIVLGGVLGWASTLKEDPGPREPGISEMEAMATPVQPLWLALAFPVIGACGVLVGARLTGRGKSESAPVDE